MADLTIRDWMVIIGALLILAVLLDAWRRVYRERRSAVRLKLADTGKGEAEGEPEGRGREAELAWLRELPNGGARVVERGEEDDLEAVGDGAGGALEEGLEAETSNARASAGSDGEPAGDRAEPREEPAAAEQPARETAAQPAATGARVTASRSADSRPARSRDRAPASPQRAPERPVEDEVELLRGMSSADEPENLDWLDALEAEQKRAKQAPASRASAQLPRDVEPEAFMLNVVARNPAGFRGEDILHILLACDLRFGDMNFFHRHEQEAGRGPIQFSVANMMQPGVFDIDNMADFSTPGLVFFVTLPGPEDMMKAFDYMLETAQVVARNLEGDVLDETRSVLTRQTLEHNRQKIRDLERRLLAKTR